jgi:ATP-dependent Clp protease protease subunit
MPEDNLPLPIERTILFNSQVDQSSIGDVTERILEINENDAYLKKLYKINGLKYKRPPIEIYIDSYGGEVYQIMGLVSIIQSSKTPVHTICTGAAMSCGFILLISGHKRFAYQNSTPMYHQVSSVGWGKVADLEENLDETKRLQKWLVNHTLENTSIDKKTLKKNFKRKKDWFMTAQEALELNVIDEII